MFISSAHVTVEFGEEVRAPAHWHSRCSMVVGQMGQVRLSYYPPPLSRDSLTGRADASLHTSDGQHLGIAMPFLQKIPSSEIRSGQQLTMNPSQF